MKNNSCINSKDTRVGNIGVKKMITDFKLWKRIWTFIWDVRVPEPDHIQFMHLEGEILRYKPEFNEDSRDKNIKK